MFRRGWRKSRKHEVEESGIEVGLIDAPDVEIVDGDPLGGTSRVVVDFEARRTGDADVEVDPAFAALVARLDTTLAGLQATFDRIDVVVTESLRAWDVDATATDQLVALDTPIIDDLAA